MLKPKKKVQFEVSFAVSVFSPTFLGSLRSCWYWKELQEIIRMSDVVASSIVFNFFCERGRQGGVLKPMKKYNVYVFLAILVLSSKFLGRLKSDLLDLHEMIRVSHVVGYPIVFILLYDRDKYGGVLELIKNDKFFKFSAVVVSSGFWLCPGTDNTEFHNIQESMFYNCVLKFKKNGLLKLFLAFWFPFPKSLGRSRCGFHWNCMKW